MRIDSQLLGANASRPTAKADPTGKTGLDERQDKKLKEACKDFEALFLANLMKAMRKTVEKTNLFGSDSGEATFQEMMDSEVSKAATNTNSMGIADMLYRQATTQMAQQAQSVEKAKGGLNSVAAVKSTEVKTDD